MKRFGRFGWIKIFVALFFIIIGFAQIGATAPNANDSFAMSAANDLVNDQKLPGGLGSFGFMTGVGG
jgi:hypothetical protein